MLKKTELFANLPRIGFQRFDATDDDRYGSIKVCENRKDLCDDDNRQFIRYKPNKTEMKPEPLNNGGKPTKRQKMTLSACTHGNAEKITSISF